MITKSVADAAKEVAPPAIITVATFAGISLQDWVLYLTIMYAAIRLLCLVPRVIGCGKCFYRNRTCNLSCRSVAE